MGTRQSDKELAEKYRYLEFLYHGTHQEENCRALPHQFYVEPTNVCNLRCEMCIQGVMKRPKGYMELPLMKKIIDEIAFFDPYFDFARQGEPLIHPHIVEMLTYATKAGLSKTRLITNGTLLGNQDLAKGIIKSGLRKLNISFNGYDVESYERYQKGAKFGKVMANILEFLRLRYELKSETPYVEISIVKYDQLTENKDAFFNLFRDLPVNRIRVSSLINFFGQNEDPALDKNVKKPFQEWPTCKVPFRFFNINWNGDVTPCIIDYDGKYSIGNAKTEKILDIWNGEKMRFFRRCHIEKKFDLIKSQNGKFCEYCNNLWADPKDHGPQYPETFELGVRDFFAQQQTRAGKFASDLDKSPDEVKKQYKDFIANYKQIHKKIVIGQK
jgi:radical SAM protein with 4Fe4S-binding SPASM domain